VAFTLERPVIVAETDTDWRRHASCRHCSPDLFFPAGTTGAAEHEIAAAKAVCAECPVQSQCLRFALRTGQAYGIWGGTTEDERIMLRRLTRRPAALPA
jgi:WhiB family transcriptional regulator, redox-sensing transcriptional regulator